MLTRCTGSLLVKHTPEERVALCDQVCSVLQSVGEHYLVGGSTAVVSRERPICISKIGTSAPSDNIGVLGLLIPIRRKNYGWRCAEQSLRAIAKIFSLTADERHLSLLDLIDVPIPSPNRVNT